MKKDSLTNNATYPGFDHRPETIVKYIEAIGIFSILLKDKSIVHFSPDSKLDFRNWLTDHNIAEIGKEN